MLKKEIGVIQIPATKFQEFDCGEEISLHVEGEWEFKKEDFVEWECAQYDGFADLVKAQPGRNGWTYVTLRKQ